MGFPSLVFLDEEFALIQSLEGYQKSDRLQIVLSYFGENNYKSTPWPAFVRAYQAKFAIDKINKKSLQRVGGNK